MLAEHDPHRLYDRLEGLPNKVYKRYYGKRRDLLDLKDDMLQEARLTLYRNCIREGAILDLEWFTARSILRIRATFHDFLDKFMLRARTQVKLESWDLIGTEELGRPSFEEIDQVREALARLPARHRDVLHWRFYLGESLEEIGARVGKTYSIACLRIQKALALLAAEMGDTSLLDQLKSRKRRNNSKHLATDLEASAERLKRRAALVERFLATRCIEDKDNRELFADLFAAFKAMGEEADEFGRRGFSTELKKKLRKQMSVSTYYRGVRLKREEADVA